MEAKVQAARDAYGKEEATHVSPFDVGGTQHGIEPNARLIVEGHLPLQIEGMLCTQARSLAQPQKCVRGARRQDQAF